MKIIIFGASGKQGQRLVDEALERGHQVTAAVRDPSKVTRTHANLQVVRADAFLPASVTEAVRGHDLVLNSIGPKAPGDELVRAARALRSGMRSAGVNRLLVVGGAGSLEASPGHLVLEHIPKEWKWIAQAHLEALEVYRSFHDIDWVYLSPAATLEPGVRTGRYRLGTDALLSDTAGKSYLSMEDLAVVLLDEAGTPRHHRQRFTAVQG